MTKHPILNLVTLTMASLMITYVIFCSDDLKRVVRPTPRGEPYPQHDSLFPVVQPPGETKSLQSDCGQSFKCNCPCNCAFCSHCRTGDRSQTKFTAFEVLPGASARAKPPFYYSGLPQFLDYAENPRVKCPEMRYMGGHRRDSGDNDGEKAVCFAPSYNITPGSCLVYSFGISTDWSFDDAMAGYGCQVYSFDPTIKLPDHNRSDGVRFFNVGIGVDNQTLIAGAEERQFMSLGSIMDMLGHTNKTIDYVKLDIESGEISVFQALMDNPERLLQIKQLGIEIHPMKTYHELFYNLFVSLEYLGFTTFDAHLVSVKGLLYKHPEFPGRNFSTCYEMAWAQVENVYW